MPRPDRFALHHAVALRDAKRVATLLDDMTPNLELLRGESTVLHAACATGQFSVVRMLLEAGANRETPRSNDRCAALVISVMNGEVEIVQLLLLGGANPNARGSDGWTPLHHAAIMGSVPMVMLLLCAGANQLERTFHKGLCPLHYASHGGHVGVVEVLLGAAPSDKCMLGVRDARGHEPLHCAQLQKRQNEPHIRAHICGGRSWFDPADAGSDERRSCRSQSAD